MASVSKALLSFFKQLLASFVPPDSESAWDDYRRARSLATLPMRTDDRS